MNRLHEGFVLGERYHLESRIASGGMADVWAGTDSVLRREVAVKVMRPDADHERLFALRFRDEAVHSAALMHTNIATVFDYGEDQGLAFLVMELVSGEPLSAVLNQRGPLAPRARSARSWVRPRSRSASPTRRASCTATSSRPTSWCARTAS